jgi:hypothetical protein
MPVWDVDIRYDNLNKYSFRKDTSDEVTKKGRLSRAGDAGEIVALKRAGYLESPLQLATQSACFLTAARWSFLRPPGDCGRAAG